MSSLSDITRQLNRWFAEHNIPPEGFTLILNFGGQDAAVRFDCALRQELEKSAFIHPAARDYLDLDLRSFKMNGVSVRVESPIHAEQA